MPIEINNLYFQWPGAGFALKVPYLCIERGESLFLFGASGSGKSTFLNLLSGVLAPQQGDINILGTNLTRLGNRQRDRFRARHIGIVFQQFNLIPYLDVETNIRLAAYFGKSPAKDIRARIHSVLDSLGLGFPLLRRPANSLSVGQQQRVAIARAIINEPEIIIADEPTSALDSGARDGFMELLMRVHERQKSTIIFVSHDRALGKYFHRELDMTTIGTGGSSADAA